MIRASLYGLDQQPIVGNLVGGNEIRVGIAKRVCYISVDTVRNGAGVCVGVIRVGKGECTGINSHRQEIAYRISSTIGTGCYFRGGGGHLAGGIASGN